MGKKRKHPDVEELLARPWCYYCERDFEDLKLLISHQKAKHYKCDRCGRRLNTAGGLSVHLNQVHKESLTQVENALPNRQGLDVEVFGMEGVPEEVVQQHNTRIIQNYYQTQAERQAATGNPPAGAQGTAKKIKMETKEEMKARFAEFKAKKAAAAAAAANGGQEQSADVSFNAPFASSQANADGQSYAQQPGYGQYPPNALPTRPGSIPGQPQGIYSPPAGAAPGDDIDALIRMAEAGIKPPTKDAPATATASEAAAAPAEKKGKKDKDKSRMVYADTEVSPEEKMAKFARYAWVEAS